MALKVELKPGERILIGDSVITNSDQRTRFLVDGTAPILREKDIMTADRADTPAKRIYLAVQLMYISARTHRTARSLFHADARSRAGSTKCLEIRRKHQ